MKRYKTKNQLIYQPVGIMEKLRLRFNQHMKMYGCLPRRIYLPVSEYVKYQEIAFRHHPVGIMKLPFRFRGIDVLKL